MKRLLSVGIALAVTIVPAYSQAPLCDDWNTDEFFEAATAYDVLLCLVGGHSA